MNLRESPLFASSWSANGIDDKCCGHTSSLEMLM
jgi:hypothetical protein